MSLTATQFLILESPLTPSQFRRSVKVILILFEMSLSLTSSFERYDMTSSSSGSSGIGSMLDLRDGGDDANDADRECRRADMGDGDVGDEGDDVEASEEHDAKESCDSRRRTLVCCECRTMYD